jgi:hypothetical protein
MSKKKQKKQRLFFWVYAIVFSFACFGMFSGEAKAYTYTTSYTSSVKEYPASTRFSTLSWTNTFTGNDPATLGSNTTIEVRAGNTLVPDGSWTAWTNIANGGSLSLIDWNRWVQYRVNFDYEDPNAVPGVADVTISTYSGILTSSSYDTRNFTTRISSILWEQEVSPNASAVFQVRTSPNNSTWSSWCGPDNGKIGCDNSSWFVHSDGLETVDDFLNGLDVSGFQRSRYIQYRMMLFGDEENTFSVSRVFIEHESDEMLPSSWGETEKTYRGSVKDTGTPSRFSSLSFTEVPSGNATIAMYLRAGNTPTPDESWSEFVYVSNGGSADSISGNRYVQYEARITTTDPEEVPGISDVTLLYYQYDTFGTFSLLSSPYNSSDASNLVSRISWDESLLPQTDIRFQIRTAPDMGGSPDWSSGSTWCGPTSCALTTNDNDFADSYYTESQGEPTNSIHLEGNNDQWMQYATWISNENTGVAPTLSGVELTYLVNAPPMLQNVTATPNQDTTIAITYEVKDPDTDSGTFTQGEVIPSFEYCPSFANEICPQWFAIPSESLREQDSQRKEVNQDTYLSYDALWTPSSTIPNLERNNAKIRVTVNDSEGANNTTSSDSPIFILDTKAPDNLSLTIDASKTPALLSLSASDNSPRFMKISLTHDFSDTSEWEPFSPSTTKELQSDPDTVYVKFKDYYGNESSTIETQTLETPLNSMSQDTSNTLLTPPEYRVFISFKKTSVSSEDFLRYELFRKEGENDYAATPYDTRTAPGENYLTDSGEDVDPNILYTYKIRTLDKEGNISFFSQEVTAKANGIQDFGEGGGGSDQNPPTIANVTITNTETTSFTVEWETDELSDSTVEYQPQTGGTFLQTGVSTYADSQEQSGKHRVVVSGLLPNTEYRFKVSSTDPQGNRRTDDNNEALYTVTTNPGPAIYGVAVQSAYNTQATIVWNTNVLADTMIHYSQYKQGNELQTPITISGTSVLTTNHSLTLSGLTQGTDYYFEVTSTDSQGNIANNTNGGNYFAFSTTIDTTPPVLSAFQTPVVSNNKAVITFDTDENASHKLRYKKTNDLTFQETPWKETYDRSHYIMIDALSPNTEYEYSFLAKDINQNESQSETNTFQTLVDPQYDHPPLEKIENISDPPHILTDQKAVITFQTDQIASCMIEYGNQSQTYTELPVSEQKDSFQTNHSLHLSGLIFNTPYFYKILCQDNLGTVVESKEYSFQTKLKQVDSGSEGAETTPPTLTNIQVKDITGESAVVSWETDEVGNSLVQVWEYGGDGKFAGNDSINRQLLPRKLHHLPLRHPPRTHPFHQVFLLRPLLRHLRKHRHLLPTILPNPLSLLHLFYSRHLQTNRGVYHNLENLHSHHFYRRVWKLRNLWTNTKE